VINYTETPDWDGKVRELTDGRGVDCVVEIGGPGTIARSLKALAVGGHVSLIGASLSPSGTMLDPLLLTGRGISVGSISVGSRADFEAMNRAIALHRLRPVIDRTFPFAEAKAAYRHFESRGQFREGRDHARLMIFDRRLFAGELGDNGGEGVHVGLEDDIVGDAPALPARLEIFN
jgi:NADPH:quinone reductase-like Zn-dependent oxidoreductase